MQTINTPSVNLHTTEAFTATEQNILKEYLEKKEKRFPHRYDETYLQKSGLRLSEHCAILNKEDIVVEKPGHFTNNLVWAGGINNKFNDIKKSLSEDGYELSHIPPAVYFDKKEKKYQLVDGRTRFKILENYDISNIIVDIYEKIEGASEKTVELGCGRLQTQSNLGREIAGKVTDKDIISNVHSWIESGFIKKEDSTTKKEEDKQPDLTSIIEFINDFYNPLHVKSSKKINNLANAARDTYGQNTKRIVWIDVKDVQTWLGVDKRTNTRIPNSQRPPEDLDNPMDNKNSYVDSFPDGATHSRGTCYLEIDTTQARRAVAAAANHARLNPNCDIRIIIYFKQITDNENPAIAYNREITKFVRTFYGTLNQISECYFNKVTPLVDVVSIYGAVPSLKEYHNTKELILLNSASVGTTGSNPKWFQKNPLKLNGISSYDLLNTISINNNEEEDDDDSWLD